MEEKMKKIIGLLMCMIALAMGACTRVPADDIAPPPAETASAEPTALETEEPPSLPSAEPSLEPEETPETTEEPSPSPSATSSGPRMYSSYAHLVSYDPARGFADFDYFDLLQGEKAVAYLVDTEGYTLAEAQARVSELPILNLLRRTPALSCVRSICAMCRLSCFTVLTAQWSREPNQ